MAVVLLVLLVTYLVLYGVLRWKLPADSPGRKRADRWLWCWSSLYDGQACCFYNVIFSPVVLTIHAAGLMKKGCVEAMEALEKGRTKEPARFVVRHLHPLPCKGV